MPNSMRFQSPEEAQRAKDKQMAVTGALAALSAANNLPPLPPAPGMGAPPPVPGGDALGMPPPLGGAVPPPPVSSALPSANAIAAPPAGIGKASTSPVMAPVVEPGRLQTGGVLPMPVQPFALGGTVAPLAQPAPQGGTNLAQTSTQPQVATPAMPPSLTETDMIAAMLAGMAQDGLVPPEQAQIALQFAMEAGQQPEEMVEAEPAAETADQPAPPAFARWLEGTQDADNDIAGELRQAAQEGATPDSLWSLVMALKNIEADLPPSLAGMAGGKQEMGMALPPVE